MTIQPEDTSKQKGVAVPLILAGCMFTFLFIACCVGAVAINKRYGSWFAQSANLITPTPKLVPCPKIPAGWEAVMEENFSNNKLNWPTGSESNEYAKYRLSVMEGLLIHSITARQGVYSFRYPVKNQPYKNFYLKTSVRQAEGPDSGDYGVVFRMFGWNHYFFSINDLQEIRIFRHSDNDDDPWRNLHASHSANIKPGEFNELVVFAQDSRFVFCINNQVVAEVEDDKYANGRVGIAVSLGEIGSTSVIEYDYIKVYTP